MPSGLARTRSLLPNSLLRFLAGGIVNTAVSYALYWVLLHVMNYQLAYSLAYGFGIGLSFVINGKFVFRNGLTWWRAVQICIANLIQYFYQFGALWLVVTEFGMDKRLGLIVAIASFIPANYLLTRFIFRHPPASDEIKDRVAPTGSMV